MNFATGVIIGVIVFISFMIYDLYKWIKSVERSIEYIATEQEKDLWRSLDVKKITSDDVDLLLISFNNTNSNLNVDSVAGVIEPADIDTEVIDSDALNHIIKTRCSNPKGNKKDNTRKYK